MTAVLLIMILCSFSKLTLNPDQFKKMVPEKQGKSMEFKKIFPGNE